MAVMPSLQMLAREWDQAQDIRERLRAGQGLVWREPWEDEFKIDVYHAAKNYSVLSPLARHLLDSHGSVGMHSVPKIQHEFLGFWFPATFVFGPQQAPFYFGVVAIIEVQHSVVLPKLFIHHFLHVPRKHEKWFLVLTEFPLIGSTRIKMVFLLANHPVPAKSVLKKSAKAIKKYLVLIKRKLQRDQVCRNRDFRKLMVLVYNPDGVEDCCCLQTTSQNVFLSFFKRVPYFICVSSSWSKGKPTYFHRR